MEISAQELVFEHCNEGLCSLDSAAPRDDLCYFQIDRGATWQQVVRERRRFFESVGKCRLTLNDSDITFNSLLFVMFQLIKQLLTWYLTHDKVHECVQALVCFNREGTFLGSSAMCYLSHNSSGRADRVIFKLPGLDPKMKYRKPTHAQSDARVCGSHKRRSEDFNYIVRRTQPE